MYKYTTNPNPVLSTAICINEYRLFKICNKYVYCLSEFPDMPIRYNIFYDYPHNTSFDLIRIDNYIFEEYFLRIEKYRELQINNIIEND